MGRKPMSYEEFLEKFYKQNKNANNIEILGEYINGSAKIKCKCKIDGYEWYALPKQLANGCGCPKCYNKKRGNSQRLTHKKFINDFYAKNKNAKNIEIIEEYKSSKTKIKCKCKIDGYEWKVIPSDLLYKNCGCPKCNGMYKTTEGFKQEMKEINDDIEILGEYIDAHTKIKCRCKIDGNIWKAKPNDLLYNKGCPKCNESKGEKRISRYLDNKNIKYKRQYKFDNCRSKDKLPFDFYIPNLNIAIEYDGEDHYMIFKRNKKESYEKTMDRFIGRKIRDTIKTIYCKENNIKLIRIPYWDFDRIEEILNRELNQI